MSANKAAPKNQERRFTIEELFFSTTDRKGVIQSGNEVFARVGAFDSVEELIGKPHNIIRHPDMPRAVFKLLWDRLLADKAVAAYVKNLAKDGCYYWVIALVVPAPCGFLSVRFKPTSPILATMQNIYAQMVEIESKAERPEQRNASMAASGEYLQQELSNLGFANYEDFMHIALAAEMSAREKELASSEFSHEMKAHLAANGNLESRLQNYEELKGQLDRLFERAEGFLSLIADLGDKSTYLQNLSHEVHLLSLNAIISSHHLADAGRGLAVVTHSLADISAESSIVIDKLRVGITTLISYLRSTAFAITAAKVQVEMAIFFLKEVLRSSAEDTPARNVDQDLETLEGSFRQSSIELNDSISNVRKPVRILQDLVGDLELVLRTLASVHVLGKVEVSHINESGHFQTVFLEVHQQLEIARDEVKEFDAAIQGLAQGLPEFEKNSHVLSKTLKVLAA